jgi:hypothetical protein
MREEAGHPEPRLRDLFETSREEIPDFPQIDHFEAQ